MARVKFIGIRETLTSLLPKAQLQRMARESGAMRRRRKVDPSAMFWCVVLGFGTGAERTLAGLRRSYERATGKSLVPSSFYDRFTPGLARMFRAVLAQLMNKLASSDVRYGGVLEGFGDVLAADATVVKLHRLLARRFPGTRTNSSPAAAKLHLVMSVRGSGAHKVKVTGERAKDHRALQMGPWVAGRLLLFDLGYFRYQIFDCIDRNGDYFITRLSANANPRIVAVHRRWRGDAMDLEGKRLNEVTGRLQQEVLDVEVEVTFQRHRRSLTSWCCPVASSELLVSDVVVVECAAGDPTAASGWEVSRVGLPTLATTEETEALADAPLSVMALPLSA